MKFPLAPFRMDFIALHVAVFLAVSFAHAALDSWAVGVATPQVTFIFPLTARLMRSWYNTLPAVVSMYTAVAVAAWGIGEARERQRRTLKASQLEALLQSSQLAALRAQLQPHFLYNTLNGIAALVASVQPARAVAAIEELGDLLHASLRDDGREEITVEEEIALADRYLSLQRMRFEERLRYDWYVDPAVSRCLVPVFILQPIVENAVVHGLDAGQESLNVHIEAAATERGVELTVENDGSALSASDAPRTGHGTGLATTRARLATKYGDSASLTILERPQGGVVVRVIIPRSHHGDATDARPPVIARVS
jgi:sensor histidine kinase YesM